MTGEVQRRPPEEAASRSGQDSTDGTSPRLFDPAGTRRSTWTDDLHDLDGRRRAAQEAALEAASQSWRREAEDAIVYLASTGDAWTAEDLRSLVGDCPGPSQNSFGALISAAARSGLIRRVSYRRATRDRAGGHLLAVWRGIGEAA